MHRKKDTYTNAVCITCMMYIFPLQVIVQHVNIQGLGRTKEDLLGYEISEVFHARNLIDVRIHHMTPIRFLYICTRR